MKALDLQKALFQIGLIAELSEQWKAEDREIRAKCAGKSMDQLEAMCWEYYREIDRLCALKRTLITELLSKQVAQRAGAASAVSSNVGSS